VIALRRRAWLWMMALALMVVAFTVGAQEAVTPEELGLSLTPAGLFRGAVAVIVSLLVGYARGIKIQTDKNSERIDGLTRLFEMEARQRLSEFALLRETLPQVYFSKAEHREHEAERARSTAEHRERVERELRDMSEALRQMMLRLGDLQRPSHRRSDDPAT
jgi:hypothetical protein